LNVLGGKEGIKESNTLKKKWHERELAIWLQLVPVPYLRFAGYGHGEESYDVTGLLRS